MLGQIRRAVHLFHDDLQEREPGMTTIKLEMTAIAKEDFLQRAGMQPVIGSVA
jgi:hypothetical protein